MHCCIIYIISHYLLAVEHYSLIVALFEKKAAKFSNILGYWALLNYDHLKVYYAFALLKTNQAGKAILVFKEIKPNKFDLNFKTDLEAIYHSMPFDTIN